jgi:deoxyribodipyrimidine photolyase-related protein
VVGRLILILGDQLTHDLPMLAAADPARDVIVMAEVRAEGTYVRHHPQKIALILAAMRKHAVALERRGFRVAYTRLDDPANTHSIGGELIRRAAEFGTADVWVMEPGEWRLDAALRDLPLGVRVWPDTRFIASKGAFAEWAAGRKQMRMEYFYREMRRKTGLMMEGDQPAGGQWNYDHDNRKPAKADLFRPKALRMEPDAVVEGVLDLVAAEYPDHFGDLRPFGWATDRDGALAVLAHFIAQALPRFGDYQDAMLAGDATLYHSLISPYLNIGLLTPLEVCNAVEDAWAAGGVPINAAEGFIRQIIGWREFVRGIYWLEGPDYAGRNALGHSRDLPGVYWGGPTKMACMKAAVGQTKAMAYAHHIQRLMVTGNFALLAGVDPAFVHEWYLAVYIDAFEWVEAPNTVGMSQFADGGVVGSKPYVSSGAYIDRMSDYCGGCAYKVKDKSGPEACPFNLLYWHFLMRHRARFAGNPRMGQMYRTWDNMEPGHKGRVLAEADAFLARMEAGEGV